MTIPAGYYATPDPDQPEQLTLWHVTDTAWKSWPPKARYGPVLLRKDVPKDYAGRVAAIRAHHAVLTVWNTRVIDTITADPAKAAAAFAAHSVRCHCCGRTLTDPRSQLLGVGPDCRRKYQLNDAVFTAMANPAAAVAAAINHITSTPMLPVEA